MVKRYRNGWWLHRKYHEEGMTQAEIAEECGVSPRAIRNWMKRRGVSRRDVEGENHPLYGESRSDEVRERISETMQGREFDEETRRRMAEAQTGAELPEETREKISDSLEGLARPDATRRKMSESTSGEQNPMWTDGQSGRYGPGWNQAREEVRERDEVCRQCGHDGSERRLEVHHLVPMWRFRAAEGVDLRTAHDRSNLVLLCRACHMQAEHGDLGFESGVDDPLDGDSA